MKVDELKVDPDKARELWHKYQSHRNHQSPADAEIAAIYKRIAQGKTVIRALESIRVAGVDEKGLPRLAIARADVALCYFHGHLGAGAVQFSDSRWWNHRSPIGLKSRTINMDWPDLKPVNGTHEAVV